jgi:hypothetical protein
MTRLWRGWCAFWAWVTYDPRVEYLKQMEREGRPWHEIVDAAFRMDV